MDNILKSATIHFIEFISEESFECFHISFHTHSAYRYDGRNLALFLDENTFRIEVLRFVLVRYVSVLRLVTRF